MTETSDRARVLIAGGGIAGLEALLALHDLAGERVETTLVAPQPEFVYRPMIVDEPFSKVPAERRELEPIARECGAEFVQAAEAQSQSLGFPTVARVFTPHPIQDRTDDEMRAYADDAFEEILRNIVDG